MLIGFTRFSADTFPTAMYAYRSHLDPPNELREPAVLKAGEAPFRHPNELLVNAWGTTSASVMDPDGTNMWSLQEYAAGPTNRWGTWWVQIEPPDLLDLQITLQASSSQVSQGSPITYSMLVSNAGPVTATNPVVVNSLSPLVSFVSATSSVGSCSVSNLTVSCALGPLAAGATASVDVAVTAVTPGVAAYTASVFSIETDTNVLNNIAIENVCIEFTNLPNVWINEMHYDDTGLFDTDEGVEIAGEAGIDVTGLQLVFYDGDSRIAYSNLLLSGTIDSEINGYGALWFPLDGMENGFVLLGGIEADGVALATACGQVIQFLSYEGTLTPTNDVAAGMTSQDIGVEESGSTVRSNSLQLTGTGSEYADFTWSGPVPDSPGDLNAGQTIPEDADGDGLPSNWELEFFGGPTNANPDADSDMDGATDYEEYIAGTIPTNSDSVFRIDLVDSSPQRRVRTQSASNRLYTMQASTNVTDTNAWVDIVIDTPGTGGPLFMVDTNAGNTNRFIYRLRVRLP